MTPPCILLFVVAAGLLSAVGADNCLNPTGLDPRPITKKEINLVSSFRPSHRMVTLVFSLYLKEYLNYSDVNIIYEHDQFDGPGVVANFSGRFTNSTITLHANLEAWSYPGSVLVPVPYWGQVADCGDLVLPGGRFFWKTSNHPEGLDYRQLFQSDIVAELAFDERFSREQVDNWTIKHYPCPNTFSKCALLLAENYSDTSWVVQDIEKLQMAVEVAWLGDRFEAAVRDLAAASNRPLLILTYTGHPLEEGLAAHWGSVRFPPCEVISPNNPSVEKFCPYDLHRLVKLIKVNLQTYARPVYNALHHLEFDREQYRELVLIYANHSSSYDSLRTATCAWMRNNLYMLEAWSMVPPKKETVYISGIFPVGNFSAGRNIDSLSIIQAAELAIKAVNQNSSILPNHFLDLLVNNGNCSADAVMRTFINTVLSSVYPRMVGILGPACSDTLEPLAGVTKYFPTVVISYSAEGASLNDRDKYPYFFRTISENHQYRLVYLELLKLFKWNRIATLSEDGQKYTEYISHTQDLLQKHNIHFIANPRFPRGRASLDYGAYLRELRDARARIIIADIQEDAAVALMCEAYKHNMTAYQGYVWFLPSWLSKNWWNVNNTHCKKEELVMAIDGYLALSPREYAASNEIMQENITVGQWLKKYEKTSPAISPYGGYAYDAVWVYAIALHKLLIENATRFDELHANYTTIDLVKYISQTDFQGVSGRIKFSLGSSRSSEVLIFQWLKSDNYSKREVGYFKPDQDAESGVLFMHNVTKLIWLIPGGKTPDDGALGEPECVFQALAEGLSLSCEAAIVVVNVAGFGFLGIILVVLFFIAKKRYERKQESIMRDLVGMEVVTAKSLDRWEFPRDRVVINRKLGQGAFGAVYGGEAQLSDKNWTAVAVKTLKPGSTTEIKLDFLSEAEVMKRFDHTNIVKLLGVCTKNEPVYTIMEFMLYGDLKTFLLARRHLVTSPSEESEEVSPKRLTSMVNDVARALSYLAELKYVHRDVACRNCLVNASRLVKLADFGMTRPIYESDYYKFSRKGMLPVRWMAPESLALGIFTPSSDVWSYGVLLYEVMTFGSFPFQGMSNSQVLEHVKNGGTLVVPSGAKPQLEALIKSCWNPEHKKRPQAREIVDFLANNPRLLAPCLDAPIASVQFEEPQGELPLPESIRKVSITLRRRLNSSATEPLLPPYLYGSPQPSTAAEEDEEDVV